MGSSVHTQTHIHRHTKTHTDTHTDRQRYTKTHYTYLTTVIHGMFTAKSTHEVLLRGFPGGSVVKNPPANTGTHL